MQQRASGSIDRPATFELIWSEGRDMHRPMRTRGLRDQIEDILAGKASAAPEYREEIAAMQEQAAWIRGLRAPADCEPKPVFYARVMELIDAQLAISIWILFF